MGSGASKCEWRHALEVRGGFGEFWRMLVDFRLLVEALGRCRTRWGCKWKSQSRKNVYLSPYVEESLNSKIIKCFIPEVRSRQVFFMFWDSYVLSLWTLDVRFTHSHIMAMVQRDYYLVLVYIVNKVRCSLYIWLRFWIQLKYLFWMLFQIFEGINISFYDYTF